ADEVHRITSGVQCVRRIIKLHSRNPEDCRYALVDQRVCQQLAACGICHVLPLVPLCMIDCIRYIELLQTDDCRRLAASSVHKTLRIVRRSAHVESRAERRTQIVVSNPGDIHTFHRVAPSTSVADRVVTEVEAMIKSGPLEPGYRIG